MSTQKQYRYIWSEKRSLINTESHIRQYISERDIFGSTHRYSFVYALNGLAEELHRDQDNREWIKLGEQLLYKRRFLTLLREGVTLRRQFASFIKIIQQSNLSKFSDQELVNTFLLACRFHSRYRALFKTSRGEFLTAAEEKLRAILLKKIVDQQECSRVFEVLTTPTVFDDVNKEKNDWLGVLVAKGDRRQSILRHLNRYPWLVAHSYDLDAILRDQMQRLKNDKKHIAKRRQELKKLQKDKRALARAQQQWLRRINNATATYLAWMFREASVERMRLKGGWAGSDFLYLPLYREIARRTGIGLNDLYSSYRIDDVVRAIKTHRPSVKSVELRRRRQAFVLWLRNGRLSFYSGNEALRIIDRQRTFMMKRSDGKTIKGQSASRGSVVGPVHSVIPGDTDMLGEALRSFPIGAVLVTTMTQPNMVPIMKKASAVVTDEGGLTSHAAIIAREFGIPCIVGTEIATKILKNGYTVEVDGQEGTVKIL